MNELLPENKAKPNADYRLELTVRNNRILHYMRQMGFSSVAELCRNGDMNPVEVGQLLNFKKSPLTHTGEWRVCALKLAEALFCEPSDLWAEAQRNLTLATNKYSLDIAESQLSQIGAGPQTKVLCDERNKHLNEVLRALTPREEKAVRMRFGLDPYFREHTYNEMAEEFDLSTQRISQIVTNAMARMRDPSVRAILEDVIEVEVD